MGRSSDCHALPDGATTGLVARRPGTGISVNPPGNRSRSAALAGYVSGHGTCDRRPGRFQIDRLEPLWAQLLAHHSQQAAHLAALGAVRPPRDSWRLRRGQYLGWLQEPSTRVLAARDGDRLLGYAAVRVLEAPGSWQWGDRVGVLETLVVDDEARGAGPGSPSSPRRASISMNWASR